MSRIISPSVQFTTSTVTSPSQAVQQITGAFVGPTKKGRYFVPTYVENYAEFVEKFGGVSHDNYTAMAVRNYLEETTGATIVAIAGKGYEDVKAWNLSVGDHVIAQLYLSKAGIENQDVDSITVSGDADNFSISIEDSTSTVLEEYTGISLSRTSNNKFIGDYKNPKSDSIEFFVKYMVDVEELEITDWDTQAVSVDSVVGDVSFPSYQPSHSPTVISQDGQELFRLVTLQDNANQEFKISVENIKSASEVGGNYGSFDVSVRRYGDSDRRPQIVEQFTDLNFNPQSNNYIRRVIGDKYEFYDNVNNRVGENGVFENGSSFIRVEVINENDIPENAVPWGFTGYDVPVDYFNTLQASDIPFYKYPSEDEDADYYGVDFTKFYINYLHNELPTGQLEQVPNFVLSSDPVVDVDKGNRAFTFGFFDGTDGLDPTVTKNIGEDITPSNTFGLDLSPEQQSVPEGAEVQAYRNAIRTLEDPEMVDINLLTLPGINTTQHPHIVNFAIERMESRGDVFVIVDAGSINEGINSMVQSMVGFDTYQAGAFAPWIWAQEPDLNQVMPVPPSVVIPSVFAYNDNVARPWFAPLGLNRGVISQSIKPTILYRLSERDELYDDRINPIARILGEGTVVLGQKTLLSDQDDPLNRINVVRLLIEAQKFISTVAWRVIGEPINESTRAGLQTTINDYLEVVQEENGLQRFGVDFSENLNTPDVVNRNLIRGVIFLVPQFATEGIQIQFVVGDTGVEFDI